MHEIISLQLGQASNYTATHFWNTQESYFTYGDDASEPPVDPNIHWRSGIGADGSETFLPRTVIYDLKGGFGSLRKINALYEPEDDAGPATAPQTWGGSTVVQELPKIPQSAYQQSLDAGEAAPELTTDNVRFWSDFSRVYYHPKSLNQLYDYELNSTIRPFDKWHLGRDLFESLDKEHDLLDRDFRPFTEEADHMQAIQVYTTIDDAWGGFAADYFDRLQDEYPKTTLWVWGLQSSRPNRLQLGNVARSVAALRESATMLVPLSVPHHGLPSTVRLSTQSQWQTSALISTALETAGLASRARQPSARRFMSDMVDRLNVSGKQKVSRLQMSPFLPAAKAARGAEDSVGASEDHVQPPLDVDFFHLTGCKTASKLRSIEDPHVFGQSVTARASNREDDISSAENDGRLPAPRPQHTHYQEDAFPLLDSFPRIYLDQEQNLPVNDRIGVRTKLSTDTSVLGALKDLRKAAVPSLSIEEREDLGNELADLASAYKEGWSSGSDADDDED